MLMNIRILNLHSTEACALIPTQNNGVENNKSTNRC